MDARDAFFSLHRDLPREGPGSPESTARALFLVPTLPAQPRILDLGCGPGAQTLDLARLLPDARIVALDAHAPFLDDLRRRAAAEGFADRITPILGDLATPPPGPFDLVWCEGAAYFLGFERAIAEWPRHLAPGGSLALTEPIWTGGTPSPRVRAMWSSYPDLTTLGVRRRQIRDAGLVCHGDFVVPDRDWWMHYYTPMTDRISTLRPGADRALATVLDDAEEEIAVRREGADTYGYAFFVMGPPEVPGAP